MLLIDGIDEASSHSEAVEKFVRKCVEAGVRCIATSRPEGIADRSAYQGREGWDVLRLPELTIEQQRQLVKNVVEVKKTEGELAEGASIELSRGENRKEGEIQRKRENGLLDILWDDGTEELGVDASTVHAIGAKVYFEHLFNFTESRKQYDADYSSLKNEDRVFLENKTLPIQTTTSFQVGRDGVKIDCGLPRGDLIKMFEAVSRTLEEIWKEKGLQDYERREKEKAVQQSIVSSDKAFSLQFGALGKRLFELYGVAVVANKELANILKGVCDKALSSDYGGRFFAGRTSLVLVDLKGIKRVLEKAIHDYSEEGDEEGGLRKVLDIVRASIMCDTPKEMGKVLDALEKSPRVQIARFKNFFRNPDATHFRRMAVNLVVHARLGDVDVPHIVELQIHLRDIFQFKQNNKDFMHRPYEYFREAGKKEVVMPRLKKQMDAMTEIADTPVLLALFCSAANFDGAERPTLPSSRHELYRWALTARLKDEGLMKLCQAIAFDNFTNQNRREFTIDHVNLARKNGGVDCEFPEYRHGASMPFIKVLDASTGLFQFSHLSIQEAFAGFHAKDFPIDAKHVLHRGALNFFRICERGSLNVKFEDGAIQKGSFIENTWLEHFAWIITTAVMSPACLTTLMQLKLGSCNLTGWSILSVVQELLNN